MSIINILKQKKQEYDPLNVITKVLDNLEEMFGVTLIEKDLLIKTDHFSNDGILIPILGYDKSYKLVLFEIRADMYGALVKNSFLAIDYIKENKSIIKILLKKYLSEEILSYINFEARLIVVGEDFFKNDEYAIKQLPYDVDLIKISYFKTLVLEKFYTSHNDLVRKINVSNEKKLSLLKQLHESILALDDVIVATGTTNFITYRGVRHVS